MATNKVIKLEFQSYTIMIRTLIDEIKDHVINQNGSRTITVFPREHLSIKDQNGKYLNDKQILKIIKKGLK